MGERLELLRLFRNERSDPEPFYRLLADRSLRTFPFPLEGKTIVDLGAGPGHYSAGLERSGAIVIPIELGEDDIAAAHGKTGRGMTADAERLPFPDASVDGVFCSNLLEHTPDWRRVLREIARILRPGGWGWISWTNWYSPWGGHDITPYHLLGPRLGTAVHERLKGPPERNVPFEGLFPTYVGAAIAAVESDLSLELIDAIPRYYPSLRFITRIPLVREFATWNCLLTVRRPADHPSTPVVDSAPDSASRIAALSPTARVGRARWAGRRAMRRARERLGDDPRFLPVVLRATPLGTSRKLSSETDLVVEGFPRSGNTFAVFALRDANPDLVIASHVHVPAQVRAAVDRSIPTLVVVREPVAAVASLLVAAPHVTIEMALAEYAHHHRQLLPLIDSVVIADFTDVVDDMGSVINRLNARFGLTLERFNGEPDATARTFRAIDRHHALTYRRGETASGVARPVPERNALRDAYREEIEHPRHGALLSVARDVYSLLGRPAER